MKSLPECQDSHSSFNHEDSSGYCQNLAQFSILLSHDKIFVQFSISIDYYYPECTWQVSEAEQSITSWMIPTSPCLNSTLDILWSHYSFICPSKSRTFFFSVSVKRYSRCPSQSPDASRSFLPSLPAKFLSIEIQAILAIIPISYLWSSHLLTYQLFLFIH